MLTKAELEDRLRQTEAALRQAEVDVAYWRGVAEGLKQREAPKQANTEGLGKLFKQIGEAGKKAQIKKDAEAEPT